MSSTIVQKSNVPLERKEDDSGRLTVAKERAEFVLDGEPESAVALAFEILAKAMTWMPEMIEDGDQLLCPNPQCGASCDSDSRFVGIATDRAPVRDVDGGSRVLTRRAVDRDSYQHQSFHGIACWRCGKLARVPDSWTVSR